MRTICGITRPTKPIIPFAATTMLTNIATAVKKNILLFSKDTPSINAISSPKSEALRMRKLYIKKNAKNQYEKKLLKEYKALLILYNLRWHNKNCNWSDSVASYLNGISETKIKNLYKSMILNASELINPDAKIEEILYILLNYNTNMQNNIKIMKKMYKGGLL